MFQWRRSTWSIAAEGSTRSTGEVVEAPLFFFSYARADDDGYVKRFYADLVAEVQRQSGHRGDDVGFRDLTTMQAGSLWRDELTEALRLTRTFVALCSPTYYASEYCGKEWSAYRLRLEKHRGEQGVYPPTLLPVIWVPGGQVPDVVAEIQYADEELGEVYAREGLHFLLRLTRYRDEYQEVVIRLARRVVALAEKFDPAAISEPLDLDALPSAFVHTPPPNPVRPPRGAYGSKSSAGTSGRAPRTGSAGTSSGAKTGTRARTATVRGGPQHVNFVVAAAASRDMVDHRRDLQHYGPEPYDWAPYRPQLDQRICVFAQSVASDRNLTSGLAPTDEIENLLDQAAEENQLVVLLVDPWATRIAAVRESLSTYDRRNEPTSAVMVPMSSSDPETLERYDELIRELQQTLSRNLQRGETQLRIEIANPEAFQRELTEALAEAQARVFRSGRVVRRAGGDAVSERPVLGIPERGTFWREGR